MTQTGYTILINKRSGTVLNMGIPAIEAAITGSGIAVSELCLCEPEDMQAELARVSQLPAPLLIGGGDGTLRECAKSLATGAIAKSKKAFGILPFGTMNLLANDLDLPSLQAALNAYKAGFTEQTMDAGFVNGEIFLCCASIGTMPSASVFREENRQANDLLLVPKLFLFVVENLDKNKHQSIRIEIDGKKRRLHTPAVVVSDNRFADSKVWTDSNFKRRSLTGGELAVYVSTTQTRTSHLRLMTRLLFGHWLKDPDLSELTGKCVQLNTRRKRELVSIDGEVREMQTPLDFTIKPKLVHLLVPSRAA